MIASSNSMPGWTIAEAIVRTSDAGQSANLAGESTNNPREQWIALRDRVSRGELVATGCFHTSTAEPVVVDPQILLSLDWSGSCSLALNGAAGPKVEVFNVRVFPILHAPNAVSYLDGLSLTEAFRRYVINDPEIVALAKRLLKTESRHSAVFLQGQAPGCFVDFHWPLDSTASAIAFRFVSVPFSMIGDSLPEPSETLTAVSELLADRFGRLRHILACGEIVASGMFAQTGLEGPIGRSQWVRSDISIDVKNGDLCDGQDYRAGAKWVGLILRLPELPTQSTQPQSVMAPKAAEPRKAKTQIVTKEKCRLKCLAWLEDMMSDQEAVPRSIDDLWTEAQSKWPNKLSQRDFLKARDSAITSKKAWNWKVPGRKPKSPHS